MASSPIGTMPDARTLLAAWRERGDDRLDPVRFRRIDALARRAAAHDGEVARMLEARLSALTAAYAEAIERAASAAHTARADAAAWPEQRGPGALGELVAYIASHAQMHDVAVGQEPGVASPAAGDAQARPALLDYFRDTWTRIRAERELHQSLQQVPRHAGPLHSSQLVHRSLVLMRELSPAYLEQFLSYVDTLSRLERLSAAETREGGRDSKETRRPGAVKRSVPGKSRKP